MEAVAHNPAFAKKAGVPQSVGKDFSAADKGRKFGRGGMAAVNKQNTQHGSMDMPFKSLKKFGWMKSGEKAKRSDNGGAVLLDGSGQPVTTSDGQLVTTGTDATTPHNGGAISPEQEAWLTKGGGNPDRTDPYIMMRMRRAVPDKAPVPERSHPPVSVKSTETTGAGAGAGADAGVKLYPISPPPQLNERPIDKEATHAKGGMAGMHKMPNGKMMKKSDMKKGGMPIKDGKPAFMKRFAKGGGIESRGKTQGTIIKMAAGGSVSSRADGIAQRGKTKFKNY